MPAGRDDEGFLARWSRRKAGRGDAPAAPSTPPSVAPRAREAPAEPTAPGARDSGTESPAGASGTPAVTSDAPTAGAAGPAAAAPPLPTLDDVAALTHASDYSRFVAPGVDSTVRNAAMRKLFSDPHFNVMDGLDTYIEDYGKPDPIAPALVRRMSAARALGLVADHDEAAPALEAPAGATHAASPRDAAPGAEAASPTAEDAGGTPRPSPAQSAPAQSATSPGDERGDGAPNRAPASATPSGTAESRSC
ncbi:DUF3306 domain-containing protein [Piscinibacter koreensis]|uniref:DUF3306 domain-containing protein n=1 Tax=Piscinibacter koreensis TaxID=2742824 RepID=A0A7Y6NPC4_9BURK|nr:DUF3306 domain-containing protein [Schlegelella koreensis]NUZ06855.1 DUF3306 domain-containing protein [Schlegelella koreensis]